MPLFCERNIVYLVFFPVIKYVKINKRIFNVSASSIAPMVNFHVREVEDKSPSTNQIIVYTIVLTNDGGGYNPLTGIFTVPVAGLYMLSAHVCPHSGQTFHFAIVKDGADLLRGAAAEDGAYYCSSSVTFAYLQVDEMVWVKCTSGSNTNVLYSDANRWNSFSGVLIHK